MRKVFILTLLLSSCSVLDRNNIAPGYSEAFTTLKAAIFGQQSGFDLNRETINAIPYASLLLRIGNGPEGLMILESVNKDIHTWVSSDGIRVMIQNGRIISTNGLINNLKIINFPKKASDLERFNLDNVVRFSSYYSFSQPTLIDLKVENFVSPLRIEQVEILGISKNLKLVTEEINSRRIRWNSVNRYWVDQSNFTWKSEQKISPKLPVIYYQITKKPSY